MDLLIDVVICWKIRIFAYWTTPFFQPLSLWDKLWFAEKFVSLLIEQHLHLNSLFFSCRCDLLKNSYLCLLNNTHEPNVRYFRSVVICWKIRIFAYWTTPSSRSERAGRMLWFAEKFVSLLIEQHPSSHIFQALYVVICWKIRIFAYLCLLNNTLAGHRDLSEHVVICWKIRIFAYWTTPTERGTNDGIPLWFAEKFVSLLIEQHRAPL